MAKGERFRSIVSTYHGSYTTRSASDDGYLSCQAMLSDTGINGRVRVLVCILRELHRRDIEVFRKLAEVGHRECALGSDDTDDTENTL